MKKILTLTLLVGILVSGLSAEQSGESWARLYRRLPDIKQKYAILQNITPLDDRSLEAFFDESLRDLVYGDLSQYRVSRNTYDDWEILTRTLIRELGEIKGQSATETIWDVVRTAEVPLLKAEGLVALGQMRAVEYAPDIALILRNLNLNAGDDSASAEIVAYGAVVALDKMKDDAGFESLFYASIGWYSDRVTALASEAVLHLSDNPAPLLIDIMERAADYNDKRAALSVAMGTEASAEDKAEVARTALSEGLRYSEDDYALRRQLANLRIDAMKVLIALGGGGDEAASLLDEAVDAGDLDETLLALEALGRNRSDEAARRLAGRLSVYNERQASGLGLNGDEITTVRQILFALGESGSEIGLEPLAQMAYLDYTPALIRAANEAIKKINGE